jgi:hypothetical protein
VRKRRATGADRKSLGGESCWGVFPGYGLRGKRRSPAGMTDRAKLKMGS